jgi:hypothetical protein
MVGHVYQDLDTHGPSPQERQDLWLSKDDLRDSSSWSSPPLMLLLDIHSNLITQYDYQEVCTPSQSQVNTGTDDRNSSQDGVSRLPPSHSRTSDCVILSSSE